MLGNAIVMVELLVLGYVQLSKSCNTLTLIQWAIIPGESAFTTNGLACGRLRVSFQIFLFANVNPMDKPSRGREHSLLMG